MAVSRMNQGLPNPLLRWGFFTGLLLAIVVLFLNRQALDIPLLRAWVEGAGAWGEVIFILAFALGSTLMFSSTVLNLAGGVLFGPLLGAACNLAGTILGAALAFVISRYFAADWLQRRTERHVRHLVDGVQREGWRYVAILRLMPFISPNLSNYLLGLTSIPFGTYIITSAICLIPGTMAYTYLGFVGGEALEQGGNHLIEKGLMALGFVILVGYIPRLLGLLGLGVNIYTHQRDRKL